MIHSVHPWIFSVLLRYSTAGSMEGIMRKYSAYQRTSNEYKTNASFASFHLEGVRTSVVECRTMYSAPTTNPGARS